MNVVVVERGKGSINKAMKRHILGSILSCICQVLFSSLTAALESDGRQALRSNSNEMIEDKGLKLPQFNGHIQNISVAVGRDASFVCNVKALGKFRVGWVKSDTKAIQAIHDTVITYNPRVEVSGDFKSTFILTIKTIKEEDAGDYMCQINTDPMLSQGATLNVMVPPDIDMNLTTPDLELREGDSAKLRCFGKGRPKPEIGWRREDGKKIRYKTPKGIAMSKRYNAPPAVSKRIYLNVQFPPRINSQGQLVGATIGSEVIIQCHVRGFPQALIYWLHQGTLIGDKRNDHYEINEKPISTYECISTLIIRRITPSQMGSFRCVAKNSLGEDDMHTRIYFLELDGVSPLEESPMLKRMVSTPPTSPSYTTHPSGSSHFNIFHDFSKTFSQEEDEESIIVNGNKDLQTKTIIHLDDKSIDITKYNTFSLNEDGNLAENDQLFTGFKDNRAFINNGSLKLIFCILFIRASFFLFLS
ncbi:HNT [Lepeophtheirus salmonis]|uniref:HNT n=1 Tax=Lepeophtheirus salmonis TaxID=72036 RepID=A0A7R8CKA4_LEPSM|nr:HNT [Lepeophtheirus salmonis]CAF2847453.1 HNT [Lepeophtheirus salmonis]